MIASPLTRAYAESCAACMCQVFKRNYQLLTDSQIAEFHFSISRCLGEKENGQKNSLFRPFVSYGQQPDCRE